MYQAKMAAAFSALLAFKRQKIHLPGIRVSRFISINRVDVVEMR
jgi:hypothetical protein